MKKSIPITLLLIVAIKASATDYLITTGVDGAINDGNCTLREALMAADSQNAVDQCAAGTTDNVIVLDHTVGTFNFNQGEMVITNPQNLNIQSSDGTQTSPIVNMGFSNRFLAAELVDFDLNIESVDFIFGRDNSGEGGGVLWLDSGGAGADLTLEDVTFLSNTSIDADGGAVLFSGSGRIQMDAVLFQGNTADAGAGLALNLVSSDVSSTARGINFINNDSKNGQSALKIEAKAGLANLREIYLEGNTASGGDEVAGVYLMTDPLTLGTTSIVLDGLSVVDNAGAGLYINNDRGFILIRNAKLVDNFKPSGQGINQVIVESSADIGQIEFDNILVYQSTTQQGIGMLLGVDNNNDVLRVRHATVFNHAIGVLGNSAAASPNSLELRNSIVYGNVNDMLNFGFDVDSLIGVDPLFTDSGNEDFSLTAASPAVDMFPAIQFIEVDLNGDPRIYNGLADAGALERQGPINVNVTFTGSGSGEVDYSTEDGSTGTCITDCSFIKQSNEWVSFGATADSGSVIGIWGQDCSFPGSSNCFIGVSAVDINVSKQFIDDSDVIFINGFEDLTP